MRDLYSDGQGKSFGGASAAAIHVVGTSDVKVLWPLPMIDFDDAPRGHMEIAFDDVVVLAENVIAGEGRGFEIARARLGPGRIYHCKRLIGQAERAFEAMCQRVMGRVASGKPIAEQPVTLERMAESRVMIERARLLTPKVGHMMDSAGDRAARLEIAMIEVVAPNKVQRIIDWAIQAYRAAGRGEDFGLAYAYARAWVMRLTDGFDGMHCNQIGKFELAKYRDPAS